MFGLDKTDKGDSPEKDQKITRIITGIEATKGGREKPTSITPLKVP